jgi:hypothetical protein
MRPRVQEKCAASVSPGLNSRGSGGGLKAAVVLACENLSRGAGSQLPVLDFALGPPQGQPSRIQPERPFSRADLIYLGVLSAVGFAVGLIGIYHYGYMGQDFHTHRTLVLSFPWGYSYAMTNPPGLYWFGSLVRRYVSTAHYLECIAFTFLALNSSALWILYRFLWAALSEWRLRYAAAALATLVPFRVIHSVVLASDALTFPLFALTALFTLGLYEDPRRLRSWAGLSLGLCVAMFCKYTFAGLLPPVALLLGVALMRRVPKPEWLRWASIATVALALPTAAFLIQIHECEKLKGDVATGQWLPRGAPSVMRWRDILTPQRSDLGVFSAPGYLTGNLVGFRTYSYLGLLHVSTFTDVMDIFQPPPEGVPTDWDRRTDDLVTRQRSSQSQTLEVAAVRLGLPFTLLGIAGTLGCLVLGAATLLSGRPLIPAATLVLTALAAGFYSLIFFSLHRLGDPYTPGFWLPRLVLPALLVFLCLGFVPLEWASRRLDRARAPVLWAILGYTSALCLVFLGFLA